jgi:hypothetical protein
MRISSRILPGAVALLSVLPCQAAEFDGSKPFICSTVDVAACAPSEDCGRETAASANIPQFFKVDVQNKTMTNARSDNQVRTSPIEHVEHVASLLVLGGNDGQMAWIATINETGQMSASAVGDQVGFVIFGSCIVP